MSKTIVIFGSGYVAQFLAPRLHAEGWVVYQTSRKASLRHCTAEEHAYTVHFCSPDLPKILAEATAVLSTVPTDRHSIDPVLAAHEQSLYTAKTQWLGYLSSTGVYGDHKGNWVTEESVCSFADAPTERRYVAEQAWLTLYKQRQLPVHIFRLAGIYGPKRNCLEEIIKGKNFTVVKPGQYFSRIHIEDIVHALIASLNNPTPGEVYNVCDDEPAPLDAVQQFAARLLNHPPLKEIPFNEAVLSERARIFFNSNKKVSNRKLLRMLAIQWQYPHYRVGLEQGCLPYILR
jgi:nucleoside-diphosphate-sugar epimerase